MSGPDASDWDSASTTSRRTLPGRRVASPGVEELPEGSTPSPIPQPSAQDQDQEQDTITAVPPASDKKESPLPSPRSLTSRSFTRSLPPPQPRARKGLPQKPGSEEGKEPWDLSCPCYLVFFYKVIKQHCIFPIQVSRSLSLSLT